MDVDEFLKILDRGHLYNFLYHFTDSSNLSSISTHGILSKVELEARGISVAMPGGNEWSRDADAHKGLEGYVNLCFTNSHPMCHFAHLEGRIPNPRYLAVSGEILRVGGVIITIGVANRADTELLSVEEGLSRLDMDVLYTRTDWNDPAIQERLRLAQKCEVLVPGAIPRSMIMRGL